MFLKKGVALPGLQHASEDCRRLWFVVHCYRCNMQGVFCAVFDVSSSSSIFFIQKAPPHETRGFFLMQDVYDPFLGALGNWCARQRQFSSADDTSTPPANYAGVFSEEFCFVQTFAEVAHCLVLHGSYRNLRERFAALRDLEPVWVHCFCFPVRIWKMQNTHARKIVQWINFSFL
jgi:hypothetical protein